MVTVKICGLSEPRTLAAALDAGADMVGFVFFAASPRHVPLERAEALGRQAEGRARKVALTVDASDDELAAIVASLEPDWLQLHGRETPERVTAVRARFGLPVLRAVAIAGPGDLNAALRAADAADGLLFDARPPGDATRPGGNGVAFDWSVLRGLSMRKPWLLAGGLHAGNIAQALEASGAPGCDVSSGVESGAGIKDPAKIARFVAQARSAGATLGSAAAIG